MHFKLCCNTRKDEFTKRHCEAVEFGSAVFVRSAGCRFKGFFCESFYCHAFGGGFIAFAILYLNAECHKCCTRRNSFSRLPPLIRPTRTHAPNIKLFDSFFHQMAALLHCLMWRCFVPPVHRLISTWVYVQYDLFGICRARIRWMPSQITKWSDFRFRTFYLSAANEMRVDRNVS